jgi:hypothetical protein
VASGISSGGSSSGEVLSGVLRDASLASSLPKPVLRPLRGESESAPPPRPRASGLEGPSWGPRGGRGWGVAGSCWLLVLVWLVAAVASGHWWGGCRQQRALYLYWTNY